MRIDLSRVFNTTVYACSHTGLRTNYTATLSKLQGTEKLLNFSRKFDSAFTCKELDAETGYSDHGARYLDHALITSWLSVDPMADKYPNISPYAYCTWNPLKLVDPDGEKIRNLYEQYKDVSNIITTLSEKMSLSSSKKEYKRIQKEIKFYNTQHNNYLKVQKALDAFKQKNAEEYDKVDNLSFNGREVDVVVGINNYELYSENKGQGETTIGFETFDNKTVEDIASISVTLYRAAFGGNSDGLSTLANEFGDAIFAVERADKAMECLNNVH